jgi:hypothetical protein
MAITGAQSSSGQLNNTRTAGHDGNATMLMLNKHTDPKVERLTNITLVKMEKMVDL